MNFDGAFDVGEEVSVELTVDEGAGLPAAAVHHEDAHSEAETLFGFGEGDDFGVFQLGEAVEFEGGEALHGEDFELAFVGDVAARNVGGVTEAVGVGGGCVGCWGKRRGGKEISALH